jgi:hypothetical protein
MRDDENAGPLEELPPVPPSMRTAMWPIHNVHRYWRNPRRKQNIAKMVASLDRYGWRQPIVVDEAGVIIVGDTRYLGAQSRGDTHVPVWVAADLTAAQTHAYRVADNRIAEETEWDESALAAELELLQQLGITSTEELEEATGFDEEELNKYLGGDDGAHHLEPIDVNPFPPYTWVLIGIETARYFEIAEQIEHITTRECFVEVTANDQKPDPKT